MPWKIRSDVRDLSLVHWEECRRVYLHRSYERTVGWPSREIKLSREERGLSGIYSSSYTEVSRKGDLGRGAMRSFLYSFSSLPEASRRRGDMGLCLEFSKFYSTHKRNDVLKRREIEREKNEISKKKQHTRSRKKRHSSEERHDSRQDIVSWSLPRLKQLCSIGRNWLRWHGDPFFLSFFLLLEMLRALRERYGPPTRKSDPAPFTIATAAGAVNSKIGNQALSFNLHVRARERESRGNRQGKTWRLRFLSSSENNFYVKRKWKEEILWYISQTL